MFRGNARLHAGEEYSRAAQAAGKITRRAHDKWMTSINNFYGNACIFAKMQVDVVLP
jgi:hypothetical protein